MSERLSDARLEEIRKMLSGPVRGDWNPGRELLSEVDRLRALLRPDLNEEAGLRMRRRAVCDAEAMHSRVCDEPETDLRNTLLAVLRDYKIDVKYLLARLDAIQGQFADFLSDHHALILEGAAQERRRVLGLLGLLAKERVQWATISARPLSEAIQALPPLPGALPPEAARREADRLHQGVREALGVLTRYSTPDPVQMTDQAREILRRLLGEE